MVALLTALLQIAGVILSYLQQKQLIDAGKAKQIKENLDGSLVLLGKANKARSDATADFDKSHGLPNDQQKPDPYRRD
jgi:hypothetical protein